MTATAWRKSTYSTGGGEHCVEVADHSPETIPIRDSKNPTGPILTVPAPAWGAFVNALSRGRQSFVPSGAL
ncbi:hypothetical protein GCM10010218_04600 [Streptomyces mashuensis]|uniref:DUF397 domain-containing protein n=1 Tax=Streptomyces mashuensis TaxID=33904 RepID=A0A919AWD9_9ACTN|nr:DUF397 domain-containing protein [Streptomyces mashuensis]GHF26759.1 hypothetical protein GCM10010218_04600 [Streptomyces mashuensis]